MRVLVIMGASLTLAACGHGGQTVITPLDPLPASICAPPEPEPQGPDLTPEQQTAADVGVIVALGETVGVPLIRHREVEHPAWGRRQAERVKAAADYCATR